MEIRSRSRKSMVFNPLLNLKDDCRPRAGQGHIVRKRSSMRKIKSGLAALPPLLFHTCAHDLPTTGQNLLYMLMWPRNYMHGDQFADATRCCGSRIGSGFYRTPVSTKH